MYFPHSRSEDSEYCREQGYDEHQIIRRNWMIYVYCKKDGIHMAKIYKHARK